MFDKIQSRRVASNTTVSGGNPPKISAAAEVFSSLTTTTKTAAEATGVGGVRGSCGRGIEGPHHHPQDFTIFSLRRKPPLLVSYFIISYYILYHILTRGP